MTAFTSVARLIKKKPRSLPYFDIPRAFHVESVKIALHLYEQQRLIVSRS